MIGAAAPGQIYPGGGPLWLSLAAGRSLAMPSNTIMWVSRSVLLRYGIIETATVPGRSNVDAYADGAAPAFGSSTPSQADMSVFATYIAVWTPPDLEEIEYSRLPYVHAEAVFSSTGVVLAPARHAVLGWHGLRTDPERGAVALVQQGGALTDLVGERIRLRDPLTHREIFVFVNDEMVLAEDEDLSVTRRLFLALAPLWRTSVDVRVEVMN